MDDLTLEEREKVSAAIKKRLGKSRRASKKNLKKLGPLRAILYTGDNEDDSDEVDRERIENLQRVLNRMYELPKASRYARHRIRIAKKAIELLQKKRQHRSSKDNEDITSLLNQLNLDSDPMDQDS